MLLAKHPGFDNIQNDADNNNKNHSEAVLNSNQENSENKINNKQRNRFTKEEDDILKELVEKQNEKLDWNKIASLMPGRTTRQCRDRYTNYLRPQLVNGTWTDEEDQLLKKMYEEYGPQWAKISQHFPNRSDVNIKNHHTCIINRLYKQNKAKDKLSNAETNNNLENTPTSLANDQILTPIRPIEINNLNVSTNHTEKYIFNPKISDSVSFSIVDSSTGNQDLIQNLISLAKSRQIQFDEKLANGNFPITPNIKDKFLKDAFSLLINLSCLIANDDS